MAGESAERQEQGVIKAISMSVTKNKNKPITLVAGDTTLGEVIRASKFTGRQAGGSEPYTDVVIHTKKRNYNCSLKGTSAPSLAGGGLRGLELIIPGITTKFMRSAFHKLKYTLKLKAGDKVPDVFGKIHNSIKEKIVIGTVQMGGEVDFMYIGPMDVVSASVAFNASNATLTLNGNLIESKHYAKTHDLYFRLRARREDQTFDPESVDKNGVPKIYGKSPSKGDSAGRIVITDKIPKNAIIVNV